MAHSTSMSTKRRRTACFTWSPKAAETKGPNDSIALMAVLGTELPKTVTVNELTTVASTFTAARFITGEAISGNPLGLKIAAGNTPNLVDPEIGGWGKALLDPINSAENTTLANLNTLGSLITAFFTVANDDWRARFLKAATPLSGVTPKNTLEAMAGIARAPWAEPKALYALFDEVYPQPKDGSRRNAPFVPYLAFAPSDFALMLRFTGGGAAALASSFSMRKAISGAARIGCPARSLGTSTTSVAALLNSPPTEFRSRPRSLASGAWAWMASVGEPP